MSETVEEWRAWRDGTYAVSDAGRVKRVRPGKGARCKVLKPCKESIGYFNVSVCIGGVQSTVRIHRMVAEAFLPPVDGLTYVNHLDGNKENNALSNLEWSSHEENMAHAGNANLMRLGQRHGGATLSDADVAAIREQYAAGVSPTELAKRFASSVSYMSQVARGMRRVK